MGVKLSSVICLSGHLILCSLYCSQLTAKTFSIFAEKMMTFSQVRVIPERPLVTLKSAIDLNI